MAKEKEVIAKEVDFVNPFESGVSYETFLNAIPKTSTVEKYCEKHLEKDQIEWLLNDLKHFKNK